MAPASRDTVDNCRRFCERHGLSTRGVLALTAQVNRTTEFCSILLDFERGDLLDVYPAEFIAAAGYKEMRLGELLVCYADGLPRLQAAPLPSDAERKAAVCERPPFCCAGVEPYKARRLDGEALFTSLLSGRGHHPNVVFEVKRQIDKGPMLTTKHFQVISNAVVEVTGSFTAKMHAFKNFKCPRHSLFFGVDLFQASGAGHGSNFHHMRLNPFQHLNDSVLTRLMAS